MNNSKPKLISVIIPCYNSAEFLEQTLRSVVWQTYPHWECIMIDDGSTDHSAEIFQQVARQDKRFIYYRQENLGLASARNSGIDLAKGDYIQFLDADDILLSSRFQLLMERFKNYTDESILYSDHMLYNSDLGFYKSLPGKIPVDDQLKAFLFEFNRTFVIPIHAYLFPSHITEKNKFDETLHSYAEDNEYRIRLALNAIPFEFINETLVIYRMNQKQISSQGETRIFQNMLTENHKYALLPDCQKYRPLFEQQNKYLHQRIGIAHFMDREYRKGFAEVSYLLGQSSFSSILKMIAWAIVIVFFPKRIVTKARLYFFNTFGKSLAKWERNAQWVAPESLYQLMKT